ncbi:hypothetical protein Tco_0286731 [Tanacetum coccineum]
MAATTNLDEIEEVNANCILMANLQQASTSGTQTDRAPVYDSDGSAEVHHLENCYDNDIFNMFTQKEQFTELLELIPEPHQVQQNDNNVIYAVSSVEQEGGTVEQQPATNEETRAYHESLFHNLTAEVEKVNTVNHKMKETNSVYQEQCLTKKINALHLSSAKMITPLNEEIANLNNMLSKEKSTVSFLLEEKKRLKSDFKTREDELLDKQIQPENKIKELDNILVKTGQSIQTMHMLSPKPASFYLTEQKMALGYQNPFYLKQAQQKQQSFYNGKVLLEKHDPLAVYDSEETLQLAQESRLKMKQLNKEIKPANYTKINYLSGVFVSQTAKSREELCFSNTSKTANVSKSISIPNEEFFDDTTPSVARKFLNEVKSTIVTLQHEIFPIVNQVDARVQNFELQFLKEATKFVRDFKSLAKEADESLAKHKALELEIERLLRAIVSQDIMSIVQNPSVVDTSNLQTELDWSEQKDTTKGTSVNTQFCKQSILGKPPSSSESKLYAVTPFPKSKGLDNTEKIRRPHPRSNTKNDRNKKHLSSECNNVKLAIRNDKSKVVYAMCKQCLITANHDVYVLNYVNVMNFHDKKQKANVSKIANQKKHKPQVKKPKKVGSTEILASPKPSKPRSYLMRSPTGRIFDLKGKIIESSESESQSDCSIGDNACISNPQEPTRKWFPNYTFSLASHPNLFMMRRLGMLKAHDRQSEASHKFYLEVLGNRPL